LKVLIVSAWSVLNSDSHSAGDGGDVECLEVVKAVGVQRRLRKPRAWVSIDLDAELMGYVHLNGGGRSGFWWEDLIELGGIGCRVPLDSHAVARVPRDEREFVASLWKRLKPCLLGSVDFPWSEE